MESYKSEISSENMFLYLIRLDHRRWVYLCPLQHFLSRNLTAKQAYFMSREIFLRKPINSKLCDFTLQINW
jgi:hypothetical protein